MVMNNNLPFQMDPSAQLTPSFPLNERWRLNHPTFILIYPKGHCKVLSIAGEESHMNMTSVLMKFDIDIEDYVMTSLEGVDEEEIW
jgi:hypothetical protein